jgi:hypothetical protein
MSEDDVLIQRGRILSDYLDAKNKLVGLESEAEAVGQIFTDLGAAFARKDFAEAEFHKELAEIFSTAEHVKSLVADITAMQKKKREAARKLTELGLELK